MKASGGLVVVYCVVGVSIPSVFRALISHTTIVCCFHIGYLIRGMFGRSKRFDVSFLFTCRI